MTYSQQINSMDLKYNTFRTPQNQSHKALYIQRRNQLLADAKRFEGGGKVAQKYVELRSVLLHQKYGPAEASPVKSSQSCPKSLSRMLIEGETTPYSSPLLTSSPSRGSFTSSVRSLSVKSPPARCGSRLSLASDTSKFEMTGMCHILDQHKDMVSVVKFGHNDASLLGAASYDGTISVCRVTKEEYVVVDILKGHTAAVTAFDWSSSNELLLSAGLDGLICLWRLSDSTCLRSVQDQANSQILSCAFYPFNDNWIVAGNGVGYLQVLNISTGRYPKGGTSVVPGSVTATAFDHSGKLLWAGNSKGIINAFSFDTNKGRLQKGKRTVVSLDSAVSCVAYKHTVSQGSINATLLVNCACDRLILYRVVGSSGSLEVQHSFAVPHRFQPVRSTFSPIALYGRPSCIVSGSEDCEVRIIQPGRDQSPASIDKLQGHQSPVISVAFNFDETLLASADVSGQIIIWK